MFNTDKLSAETELEAFLPYAGHHYAASRNHDEGPGRRRNVSMLSPYVRLRLLPEWTICKKVLTDHSQSQAGKYIDEVCWRTYWKGWLEGRPRVWSNYMEELAANQASDGKNVGYQKAIQANSGIDCLDAWTRELTETGYLHNHARMWYASIWIHTLKLPWTLGAAFFLEHLLDGDAASNTLGWRWVAGLHTQGKSYLASRGNIQKYTDQDFQVDANLAKEAHTISDYAPKPPHRPLQPLPPLPKGGRIGLLLHDDDLAAAEWLAGQSPVVSVAALLPEASYAAHGISPRVVDFRRDCLRAALGQTDTLCATETAVCDWAMEAKIKHIVMAEPFVGIWDKVTPALSKKLEANGITLTTARHWWDEHFFPHAKAGFFSFKKAIPAALARL